MLLCRFKTIEARENNYTGKKSRKVKRIFRITKCSKNTTLETSLKFKLDFLSYFGVAEGRWEESHISDANPPSNSVAGL